MTRQEMFGNGLAHQYTLSKDSKFIQFMMTLRCLRLMISTIWSREDLGFLLAIFVFHNQDMLSDAISSSMLVLGLLSQQINNFIYKKISSKWSTIQRTLSNRK